MGDGTQTPDEFVHAQSASTGLPERMCRANMKKNAFVLAQMREHPHVADARAVARRPDAAGTARSAACRSAIRRRARCSAWCCRRIRPACTRCGCRSSRCRSGWCSSRARRSRGRRTAWRRRSSRPAFRARRSSIYPGRADVGAAVLDSCARSLIFGGQPTVDRYRGNPRVQAHGPGFSKILLGDDEVDDWEHYLDMMVESVFINSGRSCINAPASGRAATRARSPTRSRSGWRTIRPLPPEHPDAALAAFTVPGVADAISQSIDADLQAPGVTDVTAKYRDAAARRQRRAGRTTCCRPSSTASSPDAAVAKKEFMFPFVTVVECPEAKMLEAIGPTLVCTAITRNEAFRGAAARRGPHRPAQPRPGPDDPAELAAAARRQHRRVPVPGAGIPKRRCAVTGALMRILSITAGAAGMYCGSCFRDNALARELLARGHDVTLLPVYTPTRTDEPNVSRPRVLFGGISVYLQQRSAHLPEDAALPRPAVGLAARHPGVRRPRGVDRRAAARRPDRLDAERRAAACCARSSRSSSTGCATSRCRTSSTCRTRCSSRWRRRSSRR